MESSVILNFARSGNEAKQIQAINESTRIGKHATQHATVVLLVAENPANSNVLKTAFNSFLRANTQEELYGLLLKSKKSLVRGAGFYGLARIKAAELNTISMQHFLRLGDAEMRETGREEIIFNFHQETEFIIF